MELFFFSIFRITRNFFNSYICPGGGQNLERPNVERPIFRKFETSNIEITKVKLFDFSIFVVILYFYDCSNYSNTQNTYSIIYHQIRDFLNFYSFTNCQFKHLLIFEIQQFQTFDYFFFEFINNGNLMIFEILKFGNFFFNSDNHNLIPKIGKFWFCSSI